MTTGHRTHGRFGPDDGPGPGQDPRGRPAGPPDDTARDDDLTRLQAGEGWRPADKEHVWHAEQSWSGQQSPQPWRAHPEQGWASGRPGSGPPPTVPQPAAMPRSASQPSAAQQASAAQPMSQTSAPWVNQSSAGYPVSQVSAGYLVSQASAYEQGRPAEGNGSFPLTWLAAGAIALALLTGTALFGLSEFNRSRIAVAATAPTTLTQRQAPPTWSQRYEWSILTDQASSVVVGDNRVVFIDGRGTLTVLDADTGKPVFTAASPRLSGAARTMLATVQGVPMIAVVDAQTLNLWPLRGTQGAQPKQITLPSGAKVFQQGGGLMILAGKEQWAVTGAATLAPVSIPGDHIALGVAPDGFLVSAPHRGGWTFHPSDPGQAPRDVKPQRTPDGTTGEMQAGRLSRGVVAAWGDTADPARRTIGLYDAASGRLLAGTAVEADLIKDVTLTVSPGGTLASAGPVLARLTDGRTQIVERWSAHMSDSKHLYGSRDGLKFAWSGDGAPQQLDPQVTLPWGSSLDKGLSVVMEPTDTGQFVLGGLRPN